VHFLLSDLPKKRAAEQAPVLLPDVDPYQGHPKLHCRHLFQSIFWHLPTGLKLNPSCKALIIFHLHHIRRTLEM